MGQIYLEEVPRYSSFPHLPPSDILYFFWDALLCPPGWRSSSKGSCRVTYIDDISNLEILSFPIEKVEKFRDEIDLEFDHSPQSLSFEPGWTSSNYLDSVLNAVDNDDKYSIPSFLEEPLEQIPDGFPERNETTVLVKDHSFHGEPMHLLFGSPMEIQSSMEEMCQLCLHGFDPLEFDISSDSTVTHLKEGAKDWQLLLQLDCDENLNWIWGDAGMLYFWIRKQDLEKQDFSNVWCEMQCS